MTECQSLRWSNLCGMNCLASRKIMVTDKQNKVVIHHSISSWLTPLPGHIATMVISRIEIIFFTGQAFKIRNYLMRILVKYMRMHNPKHKV